jgi:hypothetical protein
VLVLLLLLRPLNLGKEKRRPPLPLLLSVIKRWHLNRLHRRICHSSPSPRLNPSLCIKTKPKPSVLMLWTSSAVQEPERPLPQALLLVPQLELHLLQRFLRLLPYLYLLRRPVLLVALLRLMQLVT